MIKINQNCLYYGIFNFLIYAFICSSITYASALKPPLLKSKIEPTQFLKQKSLDRIKEEFDVVTNANWVEDRDFEFVDGLLIRTPRKFAWPLMVQWDLYPKMTSALKKFEFNPKTNLIEVIGEAGPFKMQSWIKVISSSLDLLEFEVVRGDMLGLVVQAYLFEERGYTLAVAKGSWPYGKKAFPGIWASIFKPLAETVIAGASQRFRAHIENEYNEKKKKN